MPSSSALRTQLATKIAQRLGVATPRLPLLTDPLEFQHECVFTNDDHWKTKGLAGPVQQFPRKAYLDWLTVDWLAHDRNWYDKSRDLIVTWWAVSLHLHAMLVTPGITVGYQSKDFQDANVFLENRFKFIYDRIPSRFAKPLLVYNKADGKITIIHKNAPPSFAMAIAEGGDKVRQYKPAYFLSDEFGFQRWQERTATAVRPALDAGAKWTVVSSANGKSNLQYRIGYEDISE